MVLINYKKTETNQFLYETPANTPIDLILKELVQNRLAMSIESLAEHGPLRPEDTRGLSQEDLVNAAIETMPAEKRPWASCPTNAPQGYRLNPDPQSYRTGLILPVDLTNMMIKNSNEVKQGISHHLVAQKRVLTVKMMSDHLDTLRGVMMIAYPGFNGLPPWEPAREILEGHYDPNQSQSDSVEYLELQNTQLWWAGKELLNGKILSDYCGKNEKTKIVCPKINFKYMNQKIVRLQKSGSGAPVREPAVDEQTQKKMMAYYYKKQQEQKDLEQDNDDNHYNAQWANPKNLKNQLTGGVKDITWKHR